MGSKGAQLKQHIDATLGSGNLREAVLLPPGEDLNEWLAVNTVDFYNAISMLYATLGEGTRNEICWEKDGELLLLLLSRRAQKGLNCLFASPPVRCVHEYISYAITPRK